MGSNRRTRPKLQRRAHAFAKTATFAEQTSPLDDLAGPMGIQLVPQRAGDRLTLHASAPTLVFPTDASTVDIRAGAARHIVDRASYVLLPAGTRAIVLAKSPVAHVLVLVISDALGAKLLATYSGEVDRSLLERYLRGTELLPRTNWLNEICHRYLFERAVCKKTDTDATRFLETEILKEVYFLCRERHSARDRPSIVEKESPLVQRAVRAIEEHLFEPDVIQMVARSCGASESTLLRAFKRELGQGPLAYVRARRLDESLLLLKSKRFTVSEVASKVGYGNFAAFSHAFRARFGTTPSEARSRGPVRG